MLHDVTMQVWDPAFNTSKNHVLTVDAESGDDAVSKAKVDAASSFPNKGFRVIAVVPAGNSLTAGPTAAIEGAESEAVEDEAAAAKKRGKG